MNSRWTTTLALGALISVGSARSAHASDPALAEALFQEGRRLLGVGQIEQACEKLAESHRLDPGVGVLLYLGDCYERQGKLASAWATFQEAIPPSRKAGQLDREETARSRAKALEPRVPRLTLVPPPNPAADLSVRRDGVELKRAALTLPMPVDPGPITIELSAPGHVARTLTVELKEGETLRVELPALDRANETMSPPAIPVRPTPGDADSPGNEGLTIAGIVLTAVGAAGLGIGIGFGVVATDQWSEAERRCVPGAAGLECDAEGAEAASDADGSAWAATIGIIGGGAVATAGVGLLIGAALASDDGGATGALGSGSSPQLALSPEGARVGWRWSW